MRDKVPDGPRLPRTAVLSGLAAVLLALSLLSCSLPRVIVLEDPLTPREHINLGVSYERKGELEQALEHYRAASGDLPLAYLYMGNVHFQREEYRRAESCYRKAVRKTGNPRARNNLAWLYYTLDTRLDEAESLAAEAVRLSPENEGFRDTLERIRTRKARRTGPLRQPDSGGTGETSNEERK